MNVSDKFWGRKHYVNQHDICDYLKEWRNSSGWSTKKIDEHFGYAHTADIGLEKTIILVQYPILMTGENSKNY